MQKLDHTNSRAKTGWCGRKEWGKHRWIIEGLNASRIFPPLSSNPFLSISLYLSLSLSLSLVFLLAIIMVIIINIVIIIIIINAFLFFIFVFICSSGYSSFSLSLSTICYSGHSSLSLSPSMYLYLYPSLSLYIYIYLSSLQSFYLFLHAHSHDSCPISLFPSSLCPSLSFVPFACLTPLSKVLMTKHVGLQRLFECFNVAEVALRYQHKQPS